MTGQHLTQFRPGSDLAVIDENLVRAELTPAQRAAAIKRRKEVWEAMHPEGVPSQVGTKPGGRPREFATDTATVTGESRSGVYREVARAEALGDDLEEVVGTSLDKGVELGGDDGFIGSDKEVTE